MSCPDMKALVRLADGEATVNEAEALSSHVASCTDCQRRLSKIREVVSTLSEVAAADPRFADDVMRRLETHPQIRQPRRFAAAALAAACAVGLVVLWPAERSKPVERGGVIRDTDKVGMIVYSAKSNAILRSGMLDREDGLVFDVINRTKTPGHFMLFAVDAKGAVHWFYPAYLDAADNPTSLQLAALPEVVRLPDAVAPQDPAPGTLTVVFLATRTPLAVQNVERYLKGHPVNELQKIAPETSVQTTTVSIRR